MQKHVILSEAKDPMKSSKSGKLTVILSGAKDHLATLDPLKMILRYAQRL